MDRTQHFAAPPAAQGTTSSLWLFSWPLLSGLLAYLYLMANGRFLLRDGDTFWHIAAGRWILDHGVIPTTDPFSHTMRGAPWVAHEWLSEIVLTLVHEAGQWTLVAAVCALTFALGVALLTRALLRWLEPVYALLFAALAVFMSASHALARPHLLVMPLIVAWTIELVRARDEDRGPRFAFLPVMTVWANAHLSFTLGIALALAFALEAVIDARLDPGRLKSALRSWGAFVALAGVAAIITPHGPSGIWLTWDVLAHHSYALDQIGEWRSPDFHIFQPVELWLLGGFAMVLFQGLRLPAMRIVLLLGLVHLALKHVRYVELLGLVAPFVVAAPFAAQWRERMAGKAQAQGLDRLFARLAMPAGAGALAVAAGVYAALPAWIASAKPLEFAQEIVPAQAVQAAQQAGVTGPVLNAYEWGGYLAYAGIAPFIDGRAEMYGDPLLKEYHEAIALADPAALPALLDKYHVTWTLLAPGTPATALLDYLPGWRRIYADGTAIVHARVQP